MYNTTICQNIYRLIFEGFFVTACQDRYEIVCDKHIEDKLNDMSTDATKFGCGITITEDSKIYSLVSLCVSLNLIYAWLKS